MKKVFKDMAENLIGVQPSVSENKKYYPSVSVDLNKFPELKNSSIDSKVEMVFKGRVRSLHANERETTASIELEKGVVSSKGGSEMPDHVPTNKGSFHAGKKPRMKKKMGMNKLSGKGKNPRDERPGTKGPRVKKKLARRGGKRGKKAGLPMRGRMQQSVGAMNQADKMLKKMKSKEIY